MKTLPAAALLALLPTLAAPAAAPPNPYAGQQVRPIKALSPEEVDAYLTGKGGGLAKAAELNGYPGPSHVLALADALALTTEQRSRTETLFRAMQSEARNAGAPLVEAERELDRLFASKAATEETLRTALGRIAALQAAVRAVHLQAHLEQARILTPEQVALYMELRGYAGQGTQTREGGADHAHHAHQ